MRAAGGTAGLCRWVSAHGQRGRLPATTAASAAGEGLVPLKLQPGEAAKAVSRQRRAPFRSTGAAGSRLLGLRPLLRRTWRGTTAAARKAATRLRRVTELLDFKTGTCTKLEIVSSSPWPPGAVAAAGAAAGPSLQLGRALPEGRRGLWGVGTNPAAPGRPNQSTQRRCKIVFLPCSEAFVQQWSWENSLLTPHQ